MTLLAVIPARSGSKGLKDKNILPLSGKPLLAYSIEAAITSKIFDEVMVSTDSELYANIAIENGASVPFLRSLKTSSDLATTRECIIEVLENYSKLKREFTHFMILQPTSPLRSVTDIINAHRLFLSLKAKTVISVCKMEHSPLWANTIDESLSLEGFISNDYDVRRQDLSDYYRINGAIYLHEVDHYLSNEYFFDKTSYAYIMERQNSIDIDDIFDFHMAEFFMSEVAKTNNSK